MASQMQKRVTTGEEGAGVFDNTLTKRKILIKVYCTSLLTFKFIITQIHVVQFKTKNHGNNFNSN